MACRAKACRGAVPGSSNRSRKAALAILSVVLIAALLMVAGNLAAQGKKAKKAGGEPPSVPPTAAFIKFPDWVPSVAISPDAKLIAAGSYGVVKLMDIVEKKEAAALAEPAGFVKAVAFSPDGKTVAAGSYQVITLWDVAEKKPVKTLKGHRGYVTAIAYAPDGQSLVSASDDETVKVWELSSGTARLTLTDHEQPVSAAAFSRDGRLIASCSGDPNRPTKKGKAIVWDAANGEKRVIVEGHDRTINAVAFSPDGGQFATGSADETIKLWSTTDGKEVKTLEGHTRPVNCLAFLPDGKSLISGSGGRNVGGNEIKLWDISSGEDKATVAAHGGPVTSLSLSVDGKLLATGSLDKTVKLWDIAAIAASAVQAKGEQKVAKKDEGTNPAAAGDSKTEAKPLRAGMIGLDTSHCVAFTEILNAAEPKEDVAGCKVVAAYPKGSPDIESSVKRVPEYTKKMQDLGVEIVDSIPALLEKVDVVFLETNDGRPHLEQVLPVLKAGKPVFIDKPIAGSLADAVAIFEAARQAKVPLFSSSSLRFAEGAQALRAGKAGEIKGCDAYSPCALESTHPDLFWYGIHGVETLFTVMGAGCESVARVSTPGIDLAVGTWKGGRVGTFRGVRDDQGGGKSGYGGTAFGTKGIEQIGPYGGYRPLVVECVKFFRTGKPPVTEEETLEIYAFMEAADESKRQGGKPVTLESVLAKAREAAKGKSGQ